MFLKKEEKSRLFSLNSKNFMLLTKPVEKEEKTALYTKLPSKF